MEIFTRECLELDNATDINFSGASKMDKVYDRAARLVRRTLAVEGALVLDLSHFEKLEGLGPDNKPVTIFQADAYDPGAAASSPKEDTFGHAQTSENAPGPRNSSFQPIAPWSILGSSEKLDPPAARGRVVSAAEHSSVSDFLLAHPDGRIYERVVPSWLRHALPSGLQYAMREFPIISVLG